MRRVLLAAVVLFAVAGCTRYWAKPGGTPAELEAAKTDCNAAAVARFPLTIQRNMISPGYIAPLTTSCAPGPNGPHCVTVGGEFIPPSYSTIDVNQPARLSAYQACLVAGGWRQAKDKEEADAITRQTRIDTQPSEAAIRDARAYCETIYRRKQNTATIVASRDAFDQCVTTRARQLDGS